MYIYNMITYTLTAYQIENNMGQSAQAIQRTIGFFKSRLKLCYDWMDMVLKGMWL